MLSPEYTFYFLIKIQITHNIYIEKILSILIKLLFVCMYACNKLLYKIAIYYNKIFCLWVTPLKVNILSVSNTYTNGTTLPVSLLEQGGTLVPLKF